MATIMKYFLPIIVGLLPFIAFAATTVEPVENAACAVLVTHQAQSTYVVNEIVSGSAYFSDNNCLVDLTDAGVALGGTITLSGVSTQHERYRVPVSVDVVTSASGNDKVTIHYYASDAVPIGEEGVSIPPSTGLTATEREALRMAIYEKMIVVLSRLVFLYTQL